MSTINPNERDRFHSRDLIFIISLVLFSTHSPLLSQELWPGSQFIERPNATYHIEIFPINNDLSSIAANLQTKKKKIQVSENEALIDMTFVVYESAAIGKKPFGRIRYKIQLNQDSNRLTCLFKDFAFRKIERNARYAKLEEVGGRPKDISTVKQSLTKTQWEIIRWKTEGVIEQKIAIISPRDVQAIGAGTE